MLCALLGRLCQSIRPCDLISTLRYPCHAADAGAADIGAPHAAQRGPPAPPQPRPEQHSRYAPFPASQFPTRFTQRRDPPPNRQPPGFVPPAHQPPVQQQQPQQPRSSSEERHPAPGGPQPEQPPRKLYSPQAPAPAPAGNGVPAPPNRLPVRMTGAPQQLNGIRTQNGLVPPQHRAFPGVASVSLQRDYCLMSCQHS